MKELTQANMLEFLSSLRDLLENRQFTYYDERGIVHPNMSLKRALNLRTTPEGFMHIDVNMGGMGTGFVTYTLREDEPLLANAVDTCRMWYEFTNTSLTVRSRLTHPSWEGAESTKRFVVNV